MTHLRLIAPSGYPHDRDAMQRGVARLRELGCSVDGLDVLDRVDGRFAGTDAERAQDINQFATMQTLPDIALSVRGGYGATRLLEHLDYGALRERLRDAPMAMVGHSDFTALQMALHARSGLITFGGPMLGPDFGAAESSALTVEHFWHTLTRASSTATWPTSGEHALDLDGTLWGGNLAMICSLLGTPYFPRIDGGILFVEDVGEPPFRIERLLYQLHLSGVLGRQRALLLGDFTQCRAGPYDNGYGLDAAFAQIRRVLTIPVIEGLPFGHAADKLTLPFGAPARLRVDGGTATLFFSGYPRPAAAGQDLSSAPTDASPDPAMARRSECAPASARSAPPSVKNRSGPS